MSKRAEPWNDDDWHSDKEHDDEPPMPAPSKTVKAITRKVVKSTAKTVSDPDALRLQKLKDWRKKLNSAQKSIVNDESLELIAVLLPVTEQNLMEEIEGMTESKINQLGVSVPAPLRDDDDSTRTNLASRYRSQPWRSCCRSAATPAFQHRQERPGPWRQRRRRRGKRKPY